MEDPVGRRAYQEWLAQRPGSGGDAGEDPDRPRYHFLPEPGWMNDPVPVFAGGAYHVFFQYRPGLPSWGDIHWGHACSPDPVQWRHLPPALAPTPEGPDAGGAGPGAWSRRPGPSTPSTPGSSRRCSAWPAARAHRAASGGAPWVGLSAGGGRGALRRLRLWDLAPRP